MVGFFFPTGFEPMTLTTHSGLTTHYVIDCPTPQGPRPHSVIITLNMKLYRIPKAVPPSSISLISAKKCRKVISQMGKFVFFVIHSQYKRKITATSKVSEGDLSTQHKKVDKVMEEYLEIFSSRLTY
jgi:hypothetical protein